MIDFILKGGVLMAPILLCSVVSITLILERFYFFYRVKPDTSNLSARVRSLLKQDKVEEALKLCESSSGLMAYMFGVALRIRKRELGEKERIIAQALSKVTRQLEKNLNALAIIANVTPLLGLLGTVIGMIKTFMKIQELQGTVDVVVLSGGISEALITTAAGLSVAIPAMVFHQYFESKADNIILDITESGTEFSDSPSEK